MSLELPRKNKCREYCMKSILKRAWAEISLDAVVKNYKRIKEYIESSANKSVKVMAMVKADAYGHGAPMVAAELEAAGIDFFGVSSIDEAMQLRNSSVKAPIMITGYTPSEHIPAAIDNNISLTVYNFYNAERISREALKHGKPAKVHLKIDTGMNRLGFMTDSDEMPETVMKIKKISEMEGLVIEGIYTHFSDADGAEEEYTRMQYKRFTDIISAVEEKGVSVGIKHCLNSAGIINYTEYALDMVRPGLILYGLLPDDKIKTDLKLIPAMVLKSAVSQIKNAKEGAEISYGRSEKLMRDSKIAVLPIGYADGLVRRLSGKYKVTVNGKPAKILGKICMDQCIVDITGIPDVCEGDEAVIFGDGSDKAPTLEKMAKTADTIKYEICCVIGKRVPRLYFKEDKLVGRLNYILNKT